MLVSSSEQNYFLPNGYIVNDRPSPCERNNKPKNDAQWHVYEMATRVAAMTVLDVGCGDGVMLVEFFKTLKTRGVDTPTNIELCFGQFPDRDWSSMNLDGPHMLPEGSEVVICADVIEHLVHPHYLLNELARLNKQHGATLIISSPERLAKRGSTHMGPPPNVCHVREWTHGEFQRLLVHFGLSPIFCLVPTSRFSSMFTTQVAVCHGKVRPNLRRI
jgi:hypothetical protein